MQIHPKTYFVLSIGILLFDLCQIYLAWDNRFLRAFGIAAFLIMLILAWLPLAGEDVFRFWWVLAIVLPSCLRLFGMAAGLDEMRNNALATVGLEPLPSLVPGRRDEYEAAVTTHYVSLVLPFVAVIMAFVAQKIADWLHE